MVENGLELLRTKPEDHELHRSRVMFCLRDNGVEVAPKGTTNSHLEWFEEEGWVSEENRDEFLNQNIRGFYFPPEDTLYCYQGNFTFDEELIDKVRKRLEELKEALSLNEETRICFGPKDRIISGREFPQFFAGTLSEFQNVN